MHVDVTRATERDIGELVLLTSEFWHEVAVQAGLAGFVSRREAVGNELREFLTDPDYAVFIARSHRGHPLGFCTVFPMAVQLREEPFAILDKLFVRRDYRRRKIGHALVDEAKRFTRVGKGKRLQATMPAFFTLDEALAFFRAERFYETGGRKHKIAV